MSRPNGVARGDREVYPTGATKPSTAVRALKVIDAAGGPRYNHGVSSFGEISWKPMREFMNISKALADERRVRTLLALRKGELCACQITELFGLAPSTVSKHLSILFQAGLVESRKDGRWVYYQRPGKRAPAMVREVLDWIEKSLAHSPLALQDHRRLRKILKQDPVALCKRQGQK